MADDYLASCATSPGHVVSFFLTVLGVICVCFLFASTVQLDTVKGAGYVETSVKEGKFTAKLDSVYLNSVTQKMEYMYKISTKIEGEEYLIGTYLYDHLLEMP